LNPGETVAERMCRLLAPPDALLLDVPRRRAGIAAAIAEVRAQPSGRGVVLRGGRRSVRRVARAAGVSVTRDFIALPWTGSRAFLIEDDAASMSLLCSDILSVPPGVVLLAAPVDAALRVARRAARLGWARRVLSSRVLVGWRR
jgi:hypothetical protein